jgi:hypothetical protein
MKPEERVSKLTIAVHGFSREPESVTCSSSGHIGFRRRELEPMTPQMTLQIKAGSR